jgi:hypothetical protein
MGLVVKTLLKLPIKTSVNQVDDLLLGVGMSRGFVCWYQCRLVTSARTNMPYQKNRLSFI